jgi:hypothetical protein
MDQARKNLSQKSLPGIRTKTKLRVRQGPEGSVRFRLPLDPTPRPDGLGVNWLVPGISGTKEEDKSGRELPSNRVSTGEEALENPEDPSRQDLGIPKPDRPMPTAAPKGGGVHSAIKMFTAPGEALGIEAARAANPVWLLRVPPGPGASICPDQDITDPDRLVRI